MEKQTLKCPRCRGFVIIDRDLDGWYQQCLQCGYHRDIKDIREVHQAQVKKAHGH